MRRLSVAYIGREEGNAGMSMTSAARVFLLSPAYAGGQRARMLLRPEAKFELARRVQIGDATLGEVFAFCSGLYFHGKLAYSRHFSRGSSLPGPLVITPGEGLLPWDTRVGIRDLERFGSVPVDLADPRYAESLCKSAASLAAMTDAKVVLLGSIATAKYVDCLLPIFGERLLFPAEFVGRGDMSRGGLMLRCVAQNQELSYISVAGAVRKGARPPRLAKPQRQAQPRAR
jgi:hypothetical protein